MKPSPKWCVVALVAGVAAAVLSTPAFAGGADALDYEPGLLTLDDVRRISGLAPGEPYTAEEPQPLVAGIGDTDVPTICGGAQGTFVVGARVNIAGAGASGGGVSIQSTVGGVKDAKKTFADLKTYAKNCKAPYNDGRFAPAPQQPKVKKVGDGTVAFVGTSTSSGRTFQQLFVREGKILISYAVIGIDGSDVLKAADLNRLANTMAKDLADLDRELKRS